MLGGSELALSKSGWLYLVLETTPQCITRQTRQDSELPFLTFFSFAKPPTRLRTLASTTPTLNRLRIWKNSMADLLFFQTGDMSFIARPTLPNRMLCSQTLSGSSRSVLKKQFVSAGAERPRNYVSEDWPKHRSMIMEDPAQFQGASLDGIRTHFETWVDAQGMRDKWTKFRMCIIIDEESLQTLKDGTVAETETEFS